MNNEDFMQQLLDGAVLPTSPTLRMNKNHEIDVSELKYSDQLLNVADSTRAYDHPLMHDVTYRTSMNSMNERSSRLREEVKKDIELTSVWIEGAIDQQVMEDVQKELAENLLVLAENREQDRRLHFVVLDKQADVRSTVKKLMHVSNTFNVDIEPVDLAPGFDGVEAVPDDETDEFMKTFIEFGGA